MPRTCRLESPTLSLRPLYRCVNHLMRYQPPESLFELRQVGIDHCASVALSYQPLLPDKEFLRPEFADGLAALRHDLSNQLLVLLLAGVRVVGAKAGLLSAVFDERSPVRIASVFRHSHSLVSPGSYQLIRLSHCERHRPYACFCFSQTYTFLKVNTPGRTRTSDRRIRNPVLYPTELRAQIVICCVAFVTSRFASMLVGSCHAATTQHSSCIQAMSNRTRSVVRPHLLLSHHDVVAT